MGGSFGEVLEDLPAQDLPSAVYQAVFSLVVTEAMVRSGHAQRVDRALVSPQGRDGRRVRLSWTPPTSSGRGSGPVTVEDTMPIS